MNLFLHYLGLPYLLSGIGFTIAVTALGLAGGLIVGLVLASMQLSKVGPLAAIARGYTVIFRGTPLILQLVFAYDALPHIGLKLSAMGAAGLALAANEGPFIAEILRAGVLGIDRGQLLAGQALGMTPTVLLRRVIAPQAIRTMIPARVGQRVEKLVAGLRDRGRRTDLAQHPARVVDVRFLFDLLRVRADVSRADRRDRRDPVVRRNRARSRS
jgi:polar amino acid transport system permease protein